MWRTASGVLLLVLSSGLVAACAMTTGATAPTPTAPPGGVLITADDTAFDRQRLEVPAGRPFELLFQNREGAPHNVAVVDQSGSRTLFVGETFGGPDVRTYDMPAIAAGAYGFRCDVHPEMSGTMVAVAGG